MYRGRNREGTFAWNHFSPLANDERVHTAGVPRRIEGAYRDDPRALDTDRQPDVQSHHEPEEENVRDVPSVVPSRLQEGNEWR